MGINFGLIFTLIITFVVLTILFLSYNKSKIFNFALETKIPDPPPFSTDLEFTSFPETNDIPENPDDCSPLNLIKCIVSEALACTSCKQIRSECVHLKEDLTFKDDDGTKVIIPKNENTNEGYCMRTKFLTETCNPFHGNLTLIRDRPDSEYYFAFCDCINPGLIGNDTINGACDVPRICNGRVKDINVPPNELECICDGEGEESRIQNGIPYCGLQSILDFDYSKIDKVQYKYPTKLIPVEWLSLNLRKNLPSTLKWVTDPCAFCLITGVPLAYESVHVDEIQSVMCKPTYEPRLDSKINGFMVRRKERIFIGDYGPDAVVNVHFDDVRLFIGGEYGTSYLNLIIGKFNVSNKNLWMADYFNLKENNMYIVNLQEHDTFIGTDSYNLAANYYDGGFYCIKSGLKFKTYVDPDMRGKDYPNRITDYTKDVSVTRCKYTTAGGFIGAKTNYWKVNSNLNYSLTPGPYVLGTARPTKIFAGEQFKQFGSGLHASFAYQGAVSQFDLKYSSVFIFYYRYVYQNNNMYRIPYYLSAQSDWSLLSQAIRFSSEDTDGFYAWCVKGSNYNKRKRRVNKNKGLTIKEITE